MRLAGAMSDPSTTLVAFMALLGSSAMGMRFDRWIPSSGIPVTLTVAAILSNLLPMVPLSHPLYDFCWSWILPGSLTLLLLGSSSPRTTNNITNMETKHQTHGSTTTQQQNRILFAIARVAGPFVMACLGSILGCWLALQVATANSTWFSSINHARAAMSCLVASYIGGSVNLFATAKIIQAPTTLLSSMATADLLAMAIYFAFLASTLQWPWLRKSFFTVDQPTPYHNLSPRDTVESSSASSSSSSSLENYYSTQPINGLSQDKRRSTMTVLALVLLSSGFIVGLANTIETWLRRWIPGTACGVIAILAPVWRSILFSSTTPTTTTTTPTTTTTTSIHPPTHWLQQHIALWNSTTSQLADGFFLLFFAAIGMGIDLHATLRLGPSCFLVSLLALTVHLMVTLVGSRWLLPVHKWKISLDDVWIASNAAIGGPATAAAFCNRLAGSDVVGPTMAATVWGVVGYAIGTVIGVSFFRFSGGTLV